MSADDLAAVGSLGERSRRALYEYVVDAGDWVSRDEAADALGFERATAAHHLDRLSDDGLLDVDYQRRSGRSGPGAGRPAKLYRRARREIEVSLPPRDYEVAARLLADAATRSKTDGVDITTALGEVATEEGHRLGEAARGRMRSATQRPAGRRKLVVELLREHGFEPHTTNDGTVVLKNCPFHHLAQRHTELICGMNECVLSGALDAIGETGFDARLEPEEGLCCVKLQPRATTPQPATQERDD
jgi:predicted ArsR family transcriptional regulator